MDLLLTAARCHYPLPPPAATVRCRYPLPLSAVTARCPLPLTVIARCYWPLPLLLPAAAAIATNHRCHCLSATVAIRRCPLSASRSPQSTWRLAISQFWMAPHEQVPSNDLLPPSPGMCLLSSAPRCTTAEVRGCRVAVPGPRVAPPRPPAPCRARG
jgi:hypothetical protein